MEYIDLRSDTVTRPTAAMRQAMSAAPVGDDVYGEDPTVNRLEEMAAACTGKEAALFVLSGTMGNQIAIMVHTTPGSEIIAASNSHVVRYECGAPGRLSGVNIAAVDHPDRQVYPEDIRSLYRNPADIHYPTTSLVCLENALGNGTVVPLAAMEQTYTAAHDLGLPVHLDGARFFNAALSLGCRPVELANCCDSLSFCLSKGLCAPVGSLLCGSKPFITQARRMRKLLGGGIRQAGVLAACGLVALETMVDRLAEDHANARYLAQALACIPGSLIDLSAVHINMVFWGNTHPAFVEAEFVNDMLSRGIKIDPAGGASFRFVTHHDVTRPQLDQVIQGIGTFFAGLPAS